jgi:hypothetical protein
LGRWDTRNNYLREIFSRELEMPHGGILVKEEP